MEPLMRRSMAHAAGFIPPLACHASRSLRRQENLGPCQRRGTPLPGQQLSSSWERSTSSCRGVFGPVAAAASSGGGSNGTWPCGSIKVIRISLSSPSCGGGTNSVATIFGCKYGAAVRAISSVPADPIESIVDARLHHLNAAVASGESITPKPWEAHRNDKRPAV